MLIVLLWFRERWAWLIRSDSPKAKVIRTIVQGLLSDVALAVGTAVVAAVKSGAVDVTTKAGLTALVLLVAKTAVMTLYAAAMARLRMLPEHLPYVTADDRDAPPPAAPTSDERRAAQQVVPMDVSTLDALPAYRGRHERPDDN